MEYLYPPCRRQQLHYRIYVVNQADNNPFNRCCSTLLSIHYCTLLYTTVHYYTLLYTVLNSPLHLTLTTRAMLMNVGFKEAMNSANWSCAGSVYTVLCIVCSLKCTL